ncbi:MAG: MFS transporter [Chlamydiota bacterium]
MVSFLRTRFSSFTFLNITQFLGALNDNIFKLLIVFLLIEVQGSEHNTVILATSGATFVIPFLLFSQAAGTLADRISKRNVVVFTKYMELAVMLLGIIAFALRSPILSYTVLFMMATQSTIFGPSKYGIVPEIVPLDKISKANGLLTLLTFLAIILGSFLASFLTDISGRNFVLTALVCSVISLIGLLSSLCIEKTPPAGAKKKINPIFLYEVYKTIKRSRNYHHLLTSILGSAYFLFLGAYIQLNIIPYAMEILGLTDIQGGYLFLLTALGIGTGSVLAGKLSGKHVELGLVPFGGMGIVICCFLLHFFSTNLSAVIPLVIIVGIFGGIYVIPLDTFIQVASPARFRGRTIATQNFLSFLGVLFASGTLYLFGEVLHFAPDEGFAIIGTMTFIVVLTITFCFLDYHVRFLAFISNKIFFKTEIQGLDNLHPKEPSIFLCNNPSWTNAILLLGAQRRGTRFLLECNKTHFRWLAPLYRMMKIIPFTDHDSPFHISRLIKDINKSLNQGFSVCVYLNESSQNSKKKLRYNTLRQIIKDTAAPLIPVWIQKSLSNSKSSTLFDYLKHRPTKADITFGEEISRLQPFNQIKNQLQELRSLN